MTLAEVLLRYTGCRELTDLPQAARVPEQNKKIIAAIERLDAGQVPMTEWTELTDAFGLPPQDSPGDARNALLLKLSSVIAETALEEEPSVLREITEEPKSADAPPPEEQSDSPKESPPKKEPSKTLKTVLRIWNAITTVLVVIVVALAVVLAGVRVFGLQVFSVLSGSMEPEYHVGALIYDKKIAPEEITVGMPITFVVNEDLLLATHRVVDIQVVAEREEPVLDENGAEMLDENGVAITQIVPLDEPVYYFQTKGDANDAVDGSPVHHKNVVGTPVFSIPYLGYLSSWLQTRQGTIMGVSIALVILILTFLPDLLGAVDEEPKKKRRRKRRRKKKRKGTKRPARDVDVQPGTALHNKEGQKIKGGRTK